MEQLNKNFDYGNGTILTNPTWEIRTQTDYPQEKRVSVEVVFSIEQINVKYSKSYIYDYVDSWEDIDILNFITAKPEFIND